MTESENKSDLKVEPSNDNAAQTQESGKTTDFIPKLRTDSVHIKLEPANTSKEDIKDEEKPGAPISPQGSSKPKSTQDSSTSKPGEHPTKPSTNKTSGFENENDAVQDKKDALHSLSQEPPKSVAKTLTAHEQYKENPRVLYPNADRLFRPLHVPASERKATFVMIGIACVVSAALLFFYFDTTANEPKRQQESLQQELSKDVNLDLPPLLEFVPIDNTAIEQKLNATGESFFDKKPLTGSVDAEIIKLPADISVEEATGLYAIGLNKLKPSQFVSLLNGSWTLKIDRKTGVNLSLHYADFKSGSVRQAIDNAIDKEKLVTEGEIDSGEDDGYGNAYSNGTIIIAEKKYSWTVSAIALSQVYSVAGIPDDATYVGIRIKTIV